MIGDDPDVLMSLLKTVASHLSGAAEVLRASGVSIREVAEEQRAAGRAAPQPSKAME
ncbi:hypothetical protein [Roseobacter denitrificans]|uniref:Uncharacterized protein n=1 Tax=Roseobacter denitrificans (strain ATCC 33942 / OCh 114) TaxID=375451 RepID=Q16D89_ROSDO|nr:hypothetical protein RD1_0330 [Roseobacter denitrificans OCh 114]